MTTYYGDQRAGYPLIAIGDASHDDYAAQYWNKLPVGNTNKCVIQAADGDLCLQWDPNLKSGDRVQVEVYEKDTLQQEWILYNDSGKLGGWYQIRPAGDPDLALAVDSLIEDWNYVVMKKRFSSVDRLWEFTDPDPS
jgi:hypothetical protein